MEAAAATVQAIGALYMSLLLSGIEERYGEYCSKQQPQGLGTRPNAFLTPCLWARSKRSARRDKRWKHLGQRVLAHCCHYVH